MINEVTLFIKEKEFDITNSPFIPAVGEKVRYIDKDAVKSSIATVKELQYTFTEQGQLYGLMIFAQ